MATPTSLPAAVSSGSVGTAAQFNALRGAFRILQVVSATTTAAVGSSSTTFVSTGLSASITPQSTTSKILVFVCHSTYSFTAGTTGTIYLRRNSLVQQVFSDVGYNPASSLLSTFSTMLLDSPATTSTCTYDTLQNRGLGSGTFYTQVNSNPATMILLEVSA